MATGRLWQMTVHLLLVIAIALHTASAAPIADPSPGPQAFIQDDGNIETATEDLDFKDVPIFPKEKPPPGFKYVLVYQCKASFQPTPVNTVASTGAVQGIIPPLTQNDAKVTQIDAKVTQTDDKVTQIVENVRAAVATAVGVDSTISVPIPETNEGKNENVQVQNKPPKKTSQDEDGMIHPAFVNSQKSQITGPVKSLTTPTEEVKEATTRNPAITITLAVQNNKDIDIVSVQNSSPELVEVVRSAFEPVISNEAKQAVVTPAMPQSPIVAEPALVVTSAAPIEVIETTTLKAIEEKKPEKIVEEKIIDLSEPVKNDEAGPDYIITLTGKDINTLKVVSVENLIQKAAAQNTPAQVNDAKQDVVIPTSPAPPASVAKVEDKTETTTVTTLPPLPAVANEPAKTPTLQLMIEDPKAPEPQTAIEIPMQVLADQFNPNNGHPILITLTGDDFKDLKVVSVETLSQDGGNLGKQGEVIVDTVSKVKPENLAPIVVKLSGQDLQHLKIVSVENSKKQQVEAIKATAEQALLSGVKLENSPSVVITLTGEDLTKLQLESSLSAVSSVSATNEGKQEIISAVVPLRIPQGIKKDESFELSGEMLNASANKSVSFTTNKDFTGYKVYRVTIPTELAAKWVMKFEDLPGIEFWADPKLLLRPRGMFVTSNADILVAPDLTESMEEAFNQARLPFEVLIPDVQEAIRNENPSDPLDEELVNRNGHRLTWDRYHNLDDIDSYLEHLKVTFPKFVTVVVIGNSTEGRPIKAVKLHQDSGRAIKKAIFLDAGIHAREWISPATITYMIRELVEGGDKYDCLMNSFDFFFVPVINPDGYEYSHTHNRMWRKTRSQPESIVFRRTSEENLKADRMSRFEEDPVLNEVILEKFRQKVINDKAPLSCTGTDANRNFDFHWLTGGSSKNPCVDNYAGSKPFSEPETKALSKYILENKDQIAMYISLHAYSQMWLLPWGYMEAKPADYSDLHSLAKIGVEALGKAHGTTYMIGSIPELLYPASGSSIDWVKGVAGVKYAYTLELRDAGRYGFILPANQIVPSGRETWEAIYTTANELASRVYSGFKGCPAL